MFLFSLKIVSNFSFFCLKQSPLLNVELFFSLGGRRREVGEHGREKGGREKEGGGRENMEGKWKGGTWEGGGRRKDIHVVCVSGHNITSHNAASTLVNFCMLGAY